MEAEELDQIFRRKLEELEEVPGLHLNETATWAKIKTHLSSGWGIGGFFALVVLVAIVVGWVLLVHVPEKRVKAGMSTCYKEPNSALKVAGVEPALVLQPFLRNTPTKKMVAAAENKDSISTRSSGLFEVDLSEGRLKPGAYMLVDNKLDVHRLKPAWQINYSFLSSPARMQSGFQMPSQTILRLQMDNSLNLDNAFKIWKTLKDHGPSFGYSYRYRPYFYGDFRPLGSQNRTEIYINEYNNR